MDKGAQFSACRIYRYVLWRTWAQGKGHVTFIGLNPSTADENKDDPTIRRCIGFTKAWGFGGIYMLNIFAFRATNTKELKRASEPVGPKNDEFLKMYLDPIGLNIACWGTLGAYRHRGYYVTSLLGKDNLSCLGMTQNGQPRHPLYLKRDIEPETLSIFDVSIAKRKGGK